MIPAFKRMRVPGQRFYGQYEKCVLLVIRKDIRFGIMIMNAFMNTIGFENETVQPRHPFTKGFC